MDDEQTTIRIAKIIANGHLAESIVRVLNRALSSVRVSLPGGGTAWAAFEYSLNAVVRDISTHPKGQLFQRMVLHGPRSPIDDEPSTGTFLSDIECGLCLDFIRSHMVNRFQGELAEIVALDPVLTLIERLTTDKVVPHEVHLYWGECVHERSVRNDSPSPAWRKGADGVVASRAAGRGLTVHAVIEVKSMPRSWTTIARQVDGHVARLQAGVRLCGEEWAPERIESGSGEPVRIMVRPSLWKLDRAWRSEVTPQGTRLLHSAPRSAPPVTSHLVEVGPRTWAITLDWSAEALAEAAYEMTLWFMAHVGTYVYERKALPVAWRAMSHDDAGRNAVRQALYYALDADLSRRQRLHALRLYNIYGFGYPLAIDAKHILDPSDFPHND